MYRKVVAIVLAVMLIFSLSIPAIAVSIDTESAAIANSVAELLPPVIAVEGLSVGSLSLGTKLSVYRVEGNDLIPSDHDVYPIFSDQEIIALANVNYTEAGDLQVVCLAGFASELSKYIALHAGVNFAIIYAAEGIYLKPTTGSIYCLKNQITGVPYSIDNLPADAVFSGVSPRAYRSITIEPIPRFALSVQHVPNTSVSCCGGLCWASSMAMIVNYYETTNYSARGLHSVTGCLGSSLALIRPLTYINTLSDFGMTDYDLSYGNLNYDKMYDYIEADRLLFMRLYDFDKDAGHIVVGIGYQYTTSVERFFIQDPNEGFLSMDFPELGIVYVPLGSYNYEVDYYIAVDW